MSIRTRFGRAVLLIQDYEAAFAFYQNNLFCHKITDYTTPEGQRMLQIGFPEGADVGIWLLEGKNTGHEPAMVIYTSSIEDLYTHMQENDVQITSPLVVDRAYSYFHCSDPDGNELVIAELPGLTS